MKKVIAVLLSLCLLMTMAFAVAEEEAQIAYYVLGGAQTADGTVVDITTEGFPSLVFGIADNGQCAFSNGDENVEGTYEMAETEDANILAVTMSGNDGSSMTLLYLIEDDAFTMVVNDITMVLVNAEMLETEEAAQ